MSNLAEIDRRHKLSIQLSYAGGGLIIDQDEVGLEVAGNKSCIDLIIFAPVTTRIITAKRLSIFGDLREESIDRTERSKSIGRLEIPILKDPLSSIVYIGRTYRIKYLGTDPESKEGYLFNLESTRPISTLPVRCGEDIRVCLQRLRLR